MSKRKVRRTGAGKFTHFKQPMEGAYGRLYNFDIDGADLKKEHKFWLEVHVVPYLIHGGAATLEGLTSTKGTQAHNRELSEDRLNSVESFLREKAPNPWALKSRVADGKEKALRSGEADNQEDERWRAVDVTAWYRPIPPPTNDEPPTESKYANRIYNRYFRESKTVRGKGHSQPSPPDPSDIWKTLTDLLWKVGKIALSSDEDGEVKTLRKRALFPADWEVTKIFIDEKYSEVLDAMDSEATIRTRDVTYVWGPTSAIVFIETHFSWDVTIAGSDAPYAKGERTETSFITRDEARKSSFYTPRD